MPLKMRVLQEFFLYPRAYDQAFLAGVVSNTP